MSVIETKNLSKSFEDVEAVEDLDLTVEEGQLFGFIGPNGAGKTTVINLLTGQLKPSSGDCEVMGIDPVKEPKEVRKRVGILPEREDPPSFFTPQEYFEFVGNIRGIQDVDEKIDEWSERLKFKDKLNKLNKDLSKGEKQKVMVVQAFLHEPDLVFIDEPLINLDPVMQEIIKNYLVEYMENDKTIFLSTHVMNLANEVCSHIGIIDNGRLVKQGKLKEIKEENEDLTEAFLRLVK